MKIEKLKISEIQINPNNPRLIRDDKFKKLVQSIKDFPEMLNIRPIVVNKDMVILGGNMRFKACKEAGLKEIPIIVADNLTEEQQREFLIKDNVSGGEWNWVREISKSNKIYISEYNAPDDFEVLLSFSQKSTLQGGIQKHNNQPDEKLFVPIGQEKYN